VALSCAEATCGAASAPAMPPATIPSISRLFIASSRWVKYSFYEYSIHNKTSPCRMQEPCALRPAGRTRARESVRDATAAGAKARRFPGCRAAPPASAAASGVASVRQQAARDDMGLDLGRALEDAEDARVALDAADLVFQRVAVAAMDLKRGVGVAPGDARRQQLGHAGLDVAAAGLVLLAGGEIGQFARHHRLRD